MALSSACEYICSLGPTTRVSGSSGLRLACDLAAAALRHEDECCAAATRIATTRILTPFFEVE
jgi:hypothetical protein